MRPASPALPLIWCASALALAACDEGPPGPIPDDDEPVYYGEVDRILGDHCVTCHHGGSDAIAPFSLDGYVAAADAARTTPLSLAVETRVMPPFHADGSGACNTFTTPWLDDDELATLVAWADGATAEGDPADASPPPTPPPALDVVSATLDPGGEFAPSGAVEDELRCFVVDPGIDAERFLTAFEVVPGNPTIVHHVLVFQLADDDAEAAAVALDDADPGLGYECFGGPGVAGTSFVAGWVPGNGAVPYPEGTGIRLAPNRRWIMQVHYNLANSDGRPDRTTVDLELADQVDDEALVITVASLDLELPPGLERVTTTGERDVPAGSPMGRVWGAAMHMHQRGVDGGLRLRRGGADACLMDLVRWDFHWQHFYWLTAPVAIGPGDTLSIDCAFSTLDETETITWGEGTSDEMCISYVYVSQ